MPAPTSIRTTIANAIVAKLQTMTDYKLVTFDKVRLASGDFQDFEIPAAQVIDFGESNQHEQTRGKKTWNLAVEVVVGPLPQQQVSQAFLWNLMELTENTLFSDPKLGIGTVIQMELLGSSTDLHFMDPLYVGRIEIAVVYYQPLVRVC